MGVAIGLDIYVRNPYRVLGLSANVAEAATDREAGRLKPMCKLNGPAFIPPMVQLGYAAPVLGDEAMQVVAKCKEPRQRLVNELFWPHLAPGPQARLKATLSLVDESLRDELLRTLDRSDGRARTLARHALAIVYHNLALRDELEFCEGRSAWNDQHWRRALGFWGETLASRDFWDYIGERVQANDHPLVKLADLAGVKTLVWQVVLEFNAVLARVHAASRTAGADGHFILIRDDAVPAGIQTSVMGLAVKGIAADRLTPVVEKARSELLGLEPKTNWRDFRKFCDPLLQQAQQVLAFCTVKLNLSPEVANLAEYDSFCDVVATGLGQIVDYTGEDRELALFYSLVTTRQLLRFPLSAAARHKHETNLREDRNYLYQDDFALPEGVDPAECWFLSGELADPETSLLKAVCLITKLAPERGQWSYRWKSRSILIPRSVLASDLHRGRVPRERLEARANTPAAAAVIRELTELRDQMARTEKEQDSRLEQVRRQIQDQHASRQAQLQKEIEQAEAWEAPQLAAAQSAAETRLAEEQRQRENRLKTIHDTRATNLAKAQDAFDATKAASEAAKKSAILLGSAGVGVGALVAYLSNPVSWPVGAVLGGFLSFGGVGMARSERMNQASRQLAEAKNRLQSEFNGELQRIQENYSRAEAKVKSDTAQNIQKVKAPAAKLRDNMKRAEAEKRNQLAGEEREIKALRTKTQRDSTTMIAQLEAKLAFFSKPKPESAANDFPAYRTALANDYHDGNEPSERLVQRKIRELS